MVRTFEPQIILLVFIKRKVCTYLRARGSNQTVRTGQGIDHIDTGDFLANIPGDVIPWSDYVTGCDWLLTLPHLPVFGKNP